MREGGHVGDDRRGYELPQTVATALAKGWRHDDPPYLARIIFDCMTEGDHGSETGFGIGVSPPDNEHPIVVVDTENRLVRHAKPGTEQDHVPDGPFWSFEDYVQVGKEGWPEDT